MFVKWYILGIINRIKEYIRSNQGIKAMIRVKIISERIEYEGNGRRIYGLEEEMEQFFSENKCNIIDIQYFGTPFIVKFHNGVLQYERVDAYAIVTYSDTN